MKQLKNENQIVMPHVCVVPFTSFMCTVLVTFTKTVPKFLSFWWFQKLAVHTNTYVLYMINFFWSIPHCFFHNAIAWPELNFIFKWISRILPLYFQFLQDRYNINQFWLSSFLYQSSWSVRKLNHPNLCELFFPLSLTSVWTFPFPIGRCFSTLGGVAIGWWDGMGL